MNISELPKEIKELALLRQQECIYTTHDKGTDNLCLAFDWSKTQEGREYWEEYYWKEVEKIKPKTDKEQITDIIQKKIDIMELRKFPNYNLAIEILKDLIREIK